MKKLLLTGAMLLLTGLVASAQVNVQGCEACRDFNLVQNSGFDLGNTGFQSDLPLGSNCAYWSYTIMNANTQWCPWVTSSNGNGAINFGNGNLLAVQSAGTSQGGNATDVIWSQNFNITANTEYVWEFFIKPVIDNGGSNAGQVELVIIDPNNVQPDIILSAATNNWPIGENSWNRFCGDWNSQGTSGVRTLALRHPVPLSASVLFGIDDIFFGEGESWPKQTLANPPVPGHNDVAQGVDTDPFGNVYMTGHYLEATAFEGQTLNHNSAADGSFIVKYNECGNMEWYAGTGTIFNAGTSQAKDIVVDEINEYVYVTGTISGFEIFTSSSTTCTNPSIWVQAANPSMYIARYTYDGCLTSVDVFDNGLEIIPEAITVNQSNQFGYDGVLYVAGTFLYNGRNVFLGEFDGSGGPITPEWYTYGQGDGHTNTTNIALDVTVDFNNNVYVGGGFQKILKLTGMTNSNQTLTTGVGQEGWVAAYQDNASGPPTFLWAKEAATTGSLDNRTAVTALDVYSGRLNIAGRFDRQISPGYNSFLNNQLTATYEQEGFFGMLNPGTGLGTMHQVQGLDGILTPTALEYKNGEVYLTGNYTGDAVNFLAPVNFTGGATAQNERVFVAKLDNNFSNVVWLNTTDVSFIGQHLGENIAVGPNDNVFTCGSFQGQMQFLNSQFPDQLASPLGVNYAFLTRQEPLTGVYRSFEIEEEEVVEAQSYGELEVKAYPNPSFDGIFNFELPVDEANINARVFSLQGALVLETNLNDGHRSIDLSNMKAGIYLVELSSATGIKRIKLIKK